MKMKILAILVIVAFALTAGGCATTKGIKTDLQSFKIVVVKTVQPAPAIISLAKKVKKTAPAKKITPPKEIQGEIVPNVDQPPIQGETVKCLQ